MKPRVVACIGYIQKCQYDHVKKIMWIDCSFTTLQKNVTQISVFTMRNNT